jgi:AraC-like DNA-binding protein/mannose-6-phosphate isomerase-like protein (cupin superfamily)
MHEASPQLHKTTGWQPPNAGLRLLTASVHAAGQHQDFPAHRHDAWELIYYCAGHIECVVAGKVFQTQPGMLLIIPPGTVHFDVALTAYRQFYLHVQSQSAPAWLEVYWDDAERTLLALFAGLAREWRGRARDRAEMLSLLLRQLELLLGRKKCAPEPTAAERIVQAAERLLEERLSLSPSIQEVAAEVSVSPSSLRAHFVKLRGYPPKAHLQQVRQRRALELISSTNLSLSAVAELCGYDSASHLSRYIKRGTGRSPGTFRASG